MSIPIAEEPCNVSEEAAMAVSKYIRQLEENLQGQFRTEFNRVLDSYRVFRERCLETLLSEMPLKHASEERPGIMAQVRREFPCHISNLLYDNIAGISFTAFEYAAFKSEPFTMPPELLSLCPPPAPNPALTGLLPTPHFDPIRRKRCKEEKVMSANYVGKIRPNSFVFLYTVDGAMSCWILTCPRQDCQNREFSRDPITSGDAKAHLKQCQVSFKNEEDIVRQYGTKVVPHRRDSRDKPVGLEFIAKHNRKVRKGRLRATRGFKHGGRSATPPTADEYMYQESE